jgi:hypothetical protein
VGAYEAVNIEGAPIVCFYDKRPDGERWAIVRASDGAVMELHPSREAAVERAERLIRDKKL